MNPCLSRLLGIHFLNPPFVIGVTQGNPACPWQHTKLLQDKLEACMAVVIPMLWQSPLCFKKQIPLSAQQAHVPVEKLGSIAGFYISGASCQKGACIRAAVPDISVFFPESPVCTPPLSPADDLCLQNRCVLWGPLLQHEAAYTMILSLVGRSCYCQHHQWSTSVCLMPTWQRVQVRKAASIANDDYVVVCLSFSMVAGLSSSPLGRRVSNLRIPKPRRFAT